VVVLENHSYNQIAGAGDVPFLNSLAASASGVLLTQSYAVTHPSEPNYLALFSGTTQQLSDDSCPHSYTGPNLAAALIDSGRTFTGYSEGLPQVGFTGCSSGSYARKHNPWVNYAQLPAAVNQPMTAFPRNPEQLPSVSFVIPDLLDDMHDGSVRQGDDWLRAHLGGYARWAPSHNSLLVITTDEDDNSADNRIATVLSGAHLRAGQYNRRTNHYGVLHTILQSFGLRAFAAAGNAAPITGIWK
jgi:hypothetical protein